MAFLDFFKKAEAEVKTVENEVVSVTTGPIVSELMSVVNQVIANSSNPVVLAALAEIGVTPIQVAAIVTQLKTAQVMINQVEAVLQAQTTTTTPAPKA